MLPYDCVIVDYNTYSRGGPMKLSKAQATVIALLNILIVALLAIIFLVPVIRDNVVAGGNNGGSASVTQQIAPAVGGRDRRDRARDSSDGQRR